MISEDCKRSAENLYTYLERLNIETRIPSETENIAIVKSIMTNAISIARECSKWLAEGTTKEIVNYGYTAEKLEALTRAYNGLKHNIRLELGD